MLDLDYCELTDVGIIREHNEDFIGHYRPLTPDEGRTHGWLFVVADGVGGQDRGEVGSASVRYRHQDRQGAHVYIERRGKSTVPTPSTVTLSTVNNWPQSFEVHFPCEVASFSDTLSLNPR